MWCMVHANAGTTSHGQVSWEAKSPGRELEILWYCTPPRRCTKCSFANCPCSTSEILVNYCLYICPIGVHFLDEGGHVEIEKKQPPRRDRLTWHMRTSLLSSIYCIYCMHVCAECGILPWYSMHIEWADAHPSCTQAILAVSETPTSYRQ
jgi:hypothetical protein